MLAKNIFRVIVIAFFGMFWTFILMPTLEVAGLRFTTLDKMVSYVIAPLVGLLFAQILLRQIRGGE